MGRRSYRQHCGLAAALDVVGQRWALLIVRDLAPGPRRFTDLFAGLPGISTDMLAERLRELEDAGAVARVEVRHPAPAVLYELTGRGRELALVVADLAMWGAPLLDPADESGFRRNARWALQTIAARYRGGLDDGHVSLVVDGTDELTLSLRGDRASLRYGPRPASADRPEEEPLATLATTTDGFFALRRRPERLGADEPADVEATGDLTVLRHLLELVARSEP